MRDSATGGTTSRRRVLRLAGGGLTLAVLTAGATGCREDDAAGAGTGGGEGGGKPGGGGDKPAGGGKKGQAPEPVWTRTTSAQTYGDQDELVAAGGVVIASGSPLAALDGETGKKSWTLPDGAVPGAPMLIGKGTLYLASAKYDGTVAGYDPATGKETWRSHLGKRYRQPRPIAVDDKQVYVVAEILEKDGSSHTNVIAALDSRTGKPAWNEQRDLGTMQNGLHAAVQGRHLVYTDFKKNLTVRDTATGQQVWTHKTTKTNYGFFAIHENLVIIPQGAKLLAYDLADGKEKWSIKSADTFSLFKEPAVIDGVLYVGDSGRTMRALEPATGKKIWESKALYEAKVQVPRHYVAAGGVLYGATDIDKAGGIVAMDAKTGDLLWRFNDNTRDHHAWLVAGDRKRVYALHGKKLHALPV
ncbi:Serine/threonine-protein kinase AfsK [Streptomyces sp. YIM 130001]|uniref:PQQ-binding-like beta-propeller repeat protein n=1 Tax=Streptomyces sp. YIM 130001 TaxID=2259644 RepID=UPI000E64B8F6|nr:PQQ-binding-like beta-propeller repeat protein [Streptomyces sp. YIM 130001]RII20761.1 Serine/threonine-protein kinase AfsK [Streptomyces sp. YIM 130001]